MIEEFRNKRNAHFRLYWLFDTYKDLVHRGMYEAACKVYMLHLVGYDILADNSRVYIDVKSMWVFSHLEHVRWAWGVLH